MPEPDEQAYLDAATAYVDARAAKWGTEWASEQYRVERIAHYAAQPDLRAAVDTAWHAGREAAREEIVELLRLVAEGRREYAKLHDGTDDTGAQVAAFIRAEASHFDTAANIAEGSLLPLYGLLSSWRWTDQMKAAAEAAIDEEAGDA